jgi:hypothetical protein
MERRRASVVSLRRGRWSAERSLGGAPVCDWKKKWGTRDTGGRPAGDQVLGRDI